MLARDFSVRSTLTSPFWAEPASPATTTEAASAVSAVTKSVTRVRVALSSLASGLGSVSSASVEFSSSMTTNSSVVLWSVSVRSRSASTNAS